MRRCLVAGQWPSSRVAPGVCTSFAIRPPTLHRHSAKCSFATLGAGSPRVKPPQHQPKSDLMLGPSSSFHRAYRFGPSPPSKHSLPQKAQAGASKASLVTPTEADPALRLDSSFAALHRARDQLFAEGGIPTERDVLTALLHCNRTASLAVGASASQFSKASNESDTAASSLLSLDRSLAEPTQRLAEEVSDRSWPSHLVDQISQVAFDIVVHPLVVITPQVLEAYVVIQARLGRPETLPYVLSLYASKPKPTSNPDSLEFVQQNPDKAANALSPSIIEKALGAAIEAKNLDAAIGIIENTYATKAFIRQKLLKKALLPASVATTAPFAVYLIASHLAQFQSSFDEKTATAVATAGILAYVGFTGSMGLLAVLTQNDHMKRVTWAPGITLRERWLHEEQRAALDKVACSFGFSQARRHGEEEGPEFDALRQFVLRKGMVLDRVELMEGMS